MVKVRSATIRDLEEVASWIGSNAESQLWAGARVLYPIDLSTLPQAIQFDKSESWSLIESNQLIGFGQIVPKPNGRYHLARLISSPQKRGKGYGRILASHLIKTALLKNAKNVSLNVLSSNDRALALYESLNFIEVTRPPDEPKTSSIYMEYRALQNEGPDV